MRNKRILKNIIVFAFILGLMLSNMSSFFTKVKAADVAVLTDVVIHKIKIDDNDIKNWPKTPNEDGTYPGVNGNYDGNKLNVANYFGANSKELGGVTFTYWKIASEEIYKRFVASPNSYDTAEKVRAGLNNQDQGTVTSPTTEDNGVTVTGLGEGYYWFIENKGSDITGNTGLEGHTLAQARAVPFGLVLPMVKADGTTFGTGTDRALHVYPKNTTVKPKIDKDFTNTLGGAANAEAPRVGKERPKSLDVGTKIPYEVVTKIPVGAEYKTAFWSDKMTEGLSFNRDVAITLEGVALEQADYVLVSTDKGFDLSLTDLGLAKINKKDAEKTIKIVYSATLNSTAIVEVPESNDVTFHYGNNPINQNTPKPNTPTPNKPKEGDGSMQVEKRWHENSETAGWSVNVTLYNAQTGEIATLSGGQSATVTLNATTPTHKWTGLDKDTEYKVVEENPMRGFAPHYEAPESGKLIVTNVKTDNPSPLKPTEPKVVTYGKKFVKTDKKGIERLVGAKFVVKNGQNQFLSVKQTVDKTMDITNYTAKEQEYAAKIVQYNKLSEEAQKGQEGTALKAEIERVRIARDEAFKAVKTNYHWTNEENDALKLTSDNEGRFEITGLAEGTYKLKEIEAPKGFAKLPNEVEFIVGSSTYSANVEGQLNYNLADTNKKDAQQIKNKKIIIPQTGGIGTVIFTVVGSLVMVSALLAMRRKSKEE